MAYQGYVGCWLVMNPVRLRNGSIWRLCKLTSRSASCLHASLGELVLHAPMSAISGGEAVGAEERSV
jgi:hypothetical protein